MDMDDAYQNAAYIPGGESYPARWAAAAAAFRAEQTDMAEQAYGAGPRQSFDLFFPPDTPQGVVIFVHGGYWLRFDKSFWSHLAAGPLARGWAVAIPGYDLCPAVRISHITGQIRQAVAAIAAEVAGPIRLVGHSAGGHLVARAMAAHPGAGWQARVARVMAISPVADLAPLMQTAMNATLEIDAAEAKAESPIHQPAPEAPVTVWVGGAERPAFLDQARWLAEAWDSTHHIAPGAHHFDVIEGLCRADTALCTALLA